MAKPNEMMRREIPNRIAQANVQEARVVLASLSPYLAGVLETTRLNRFFVKSGQTVSQDRVVVAEQDNGNICHPTQLTGHGHDGLKTHPVL